MTTGEDRMAGTSVIDKIVADKRIEVEARKTQEPPEALKRRQARIPTEQWSLVRAILEGVAFSLRDTFSIFEEMDVPVRNIRLGGGGARSPLWRQIQADVYNRSVEIVEAEEGAAYGAALLAGVGAGVW